MDEEKQVFVNIQMSDDLREKLDEMVAEDPELTRSSFIRNLIRQEYDRRNPPARKTQPRVRASVAVPA